MPEQSDKGSRGAGELGRLMTLRREDMRAEAGKAVTVRLGPEASPGDSLEKPFGSTLRLFEDGEELPFAHVEHDEIRNLGGGRYSHWLNELYFSASDDSSPLTNTRTYTVLLPGRRRGAVETLGEGLLRAESAEGIARYYKVKQAIQTLCPEITFPDYGRRLDHDRPFQDMVRKASPEGDVSLERKFSLNELLKLALLVPGDLVECGSYNGGSAFFLARGILESGTGRRLCLFDSFEGLSEPEPADGSHWQAGHLKGNPETLRGRLTTLGDTSFVEVFPGWIPERFGDVGDRTFCLAHIDVDLYQPTRDSIAFFYSRMTPGGVMVFDDYGYLTCPGATKAVDEFMADKPEPIINLSSGGCFIMKQ
jgi:hypothetical protein